MSESKSELTLEESAAKLQGNIQSTEDRSVITTAISLDNHVAEKQDEDINVSRSEFNSSSIEIENVESKADSSSQDEDGNAGFVIIKPESRLSFDSQMEKQEEEENVFIIQNPDGLDIDGLDSDVLSQVQRVLAESGAENSSVMIVNEGDGHTSNPKETTTYIIDLNSTSNASHIGASSLSLATDNLTSIQHHPVSCTPSSPTTSVSSSTTSVLKPLVNPLNESASKTMNNKDNSNNTIVSENIHTQSWVDNIDYNIDQPISVEVNLLSSSVNNSTCPITLPKNLSQSSHNTENSSSSSTATNPSIVTSQVAEQLIHIAKKMMEGSSQGSQKISVDESLGKIVISSPESKLSREKPSSEPVITTMYLSSPNELKLKLKKLKTNSPVIVMQAGEEPSSSDENKENPIPNCEVDVKESGSQNVSNINDDIAPISQRTDNIAAALSSLTTGGVLYQCSECGYSSHNKHYYKQHVDLVHNEERPYKCPHCDYAGKRRHALLEHMVVHSNQRPYSCNHCNASFRKKGHLTNHVKLHLSHRLVHCGVCNIQLPDTEAFEAHLRKIHNTDKLYRCKLCEHTVVERRAMLAHLATHNESIVFYCPSCSSFFNEEKSLLIHMKEAHDIDRGKVNTESDKNSNVVGKSNLTATDNEKPNSSSSITTDQSVQSPNIVCSECGFMCTDTQVMKKHMWVHIDSSSKESVVQLKDQAAASKKNDSGNPASTTSTTSNSSAMGVLKMNVVSGMKSLPDNIVYQCTRCKFTSSDNSVFIKHMLLHKTQQKQQTPVSKENNTSTNSAQEPGTTASVITTLGSFMPKTGLATTVTSNVEAPSSSTKEKKQDSSVPFVFDQPSGRYRCLICGYHCDFQRTIKAHIWKHSGNQSIEYPVFEQAKKPPPSSSSSSFNSSSAGQEASSLPKVEKPNLPVSMSSQQLSSAQQQSLKTNSGRVIQLLPFNPSTSKTASNQTFPQIKDSHAIILPTEKSSDIADNSKALMSHLSSSTVNIALSEPSSPQALIIEDKSEDVVEVEVGFEQEVASEMTETLLTEQPDSECQEPISSNLRLNEGCTEPSVVVEIVDSVPSNYDFTSMKSQQGSPRVSDLEGSGNEAKLSKSLKEQVPDDEDQQDLENSNIEQKAEKMKIKYNLRKAKVESAKEVVSTLSKLKRQIPTDESDSCSGEKSGVAPQKRLKTYIVKGETVEIKEEEILDDLSNYESDGTASSDDTVSAGESGGVSAQPKSGICSSLLAVIEQLRERSRSESVSDKDLPAAITDLPKGRSGRRNKKTNASSEAVSALSEFHNIEKINEGNEEKFRCSLCHYTSHRICNMKIHMKTHRQKKPSECSLCDFASASSELLQEHMLQHCKVRTYACKFCPQSFNHKSTLRAHMRAHKDHEPFLCAYCVFETTNPNDYREHMHVHSGCSSRLRCPGCDHVMNSKDELTPHLMMCKGRSAQSSASGEGNKPNKASNVGVKSPKHKDSVPDAKVSSQTSTTPTPPSTQHSCVVDGCSFSSISLKELQDHLSVHCNPSLMVCDLCDFKALHSRSLKSHMKRHANDQRYVQQPLEQYKCNLCGYVCHHLPSLKSHMWRHASDQSYSYEFTNDVINAAIDHDSRVDVGDTQPDDPELLVRFINSESRIMEGELTNFGKGDGQRPTCWVTFRCCSCGFETINKAKLNIHMRSHSDIIQQTLDVTTPRKPGFDKSNHLSKGTTSSQQQPLTVKSGNRRSPSTEENDEPFVPPKLRKGN